ncbi:hypothetical protein B0H66DRAFT_107466 [Apodospora peruviana]|uniref:Uncharacterized protein n=1 Tax=Apodospora peruviana TaxID=516989 RepID=A0AAE0IGX3_9PEZI|nr:hypothetical protein B0H66DRAFT_107466 [Apodospora peruviana]
MLFPAVAALHSIALAALHVDGATDMDIYGAFQLMALGVLCAPFTIKTSNTYFSDPGRKIVFVWTMIVVAGLISLLVEFYRIQSVDCVLDDLGRKLSPDAADFPYDTNLTCGLTCSISLGPFSPIRQGSANNIYVIPEPDKLPVGTAMMLAAACCIPSIITVLRLWNTIRKTWAACFHASYKEWHEDEVLEGTNYATPHMIGRIDGQIRSFLRLIQLPIFLAVLLFLVVISERNFASPQVSYQTEPFASIGQWFPCVGAGLLLLVAGYFMIVEHLDPESLEQGPVNSSASDTSKTAFPIRKPADYPLLPGTKWAVREQSVELSELRRDDNGNGSIHHHTVPSRGQQSASRSLDYDRRPRNNVEEGSGPVSPGTGNSQFPSFAGTAPTATLFRVEGENARTLTPPRRARRPTI